uniref:hypothetical protein n=1 Tax=Agrobacterium fabrum TaxID=1176649 RepID=UPI00214F1325|nr:hypothetical protein [Agrobacterium fabrum]
MKGNDSVISPRKIHKYGVDRIYYRVNFKSSKVQKFKSSKVQKFKSSKVQKFKSSNKMDDGVGKLRLDVSYLITEVECAIFFRVVETKSSDLQIRIVVALSLRIRRFRLLYPGKPGEEIAPHAALFVPERTMVGNCLPYATLKSSFPLSSRQGKLR